MFPLILLKSLLLTINVEAEQNLPDVQKIMLL